MRKAYANRRLNIPPLTGYSIQGSALKQEASPVEGTARSPFEVPGLQRLQRTREPY